MPIYSENVIANRAHIFVWETRLPNNTDLFAENGEYCNCCFICGLPHERIRGSYVDQPYSVSINENVGQAGYKSSLVYQCDSCYELIGKLFLDKKEKELKDMWDQDMQDQELNDMQNQNEDSIHRVISNYVVSGVIKEYILEDYSHGNSKYNYCVFCGDYITPTAYAGADTNKEFSIFLYPPTLGNSKKIWGPVQVCHKCVSRKSNIELEFDVQGLEKYKEVVEVICAGSNDSYFIDNPEWNYIWEVSRHISVNTYNLKPNFVSQKFANSKWNKPRFQTTQCAHTEPDGTRCATHFTIDFLEVYNINKEGYYKPVDAKYCNKHSQTKQLELPLNEESMNFDIDLDPVIKVIVSTNECADGTSRYITTWKIKPGPLQSLKSNDLVETLYSLIPLDIADNGVMDALSSSIANCNIKDDRCNPDCFCYSDPVSLGIELGKLYISRIVSEEYINFLNTHFIQEENSDWY